MKIHHQSNEQHGEFFVLDDNGEKIAELTYYYQDEKTVNANHTYVSESLRGQGVADKLYQALITFITEKRLNLNPTCSYIAHKWKRDSR
ncbi:N-acetyltransferase [Actinobacillus succinogenes]|uniref:Acetyltransferase n=1 Tax=Actinobacillus succinogenes (strain ATCC 55618 / DSM 22257 / CCUG 43843 / 130Z) TaxID=339671 RepID=A6VLY5_ACTSZ|nr:GNAT family N-acetyltransferase [Actinobacillus succinogenes]ABR73982.1 acetyltransferase [Actinobacillus succinogenes 130Z]PHI39577.1 N-acetyltransferase [Actinobacillus succinogenes]